MAELLPHSFRLMGRTFIVKAMTSGAAAADLDSLYSDLRAAGAQPRQRRPRRCPVRAGNAVGALQCLGPGETAPAHRHAPGAIRFVIKGTGVWTTVNGDPCDMSPGDLVLTPSWYWHDHTNSGGGNMFWFDGLDLPMIEALDAVFFE